MLAPKVARPNQVYRVSVTLLSASAAHTIRASLQRESEEVTAAKELVASGETAILLMKVRARLHSRTAACERGRIAVVLFLRFVDPSVRHAICACCSVTSACSLSQFQMNIPRLF